MKRRVVITNAGVVITEAPSVITEARRVITGRGLGITKPGPGTGATAGVVMTATGFVMLRRASVMTTGTFVMPGRAPVMPRRPFAPPVVTRCASLVDLAPVSDEQDVHLPRPTIYPIDHAPVADAVAQSAGKGAGEALDVVVPPWLSAARQGDSGAET